LKISLGKIKRRVENYERPLKNGNFCSSSRKAKISTTGIYLIFRGLKFEPDAEIGQKVPFCKGLYELAKIFLYINRRYE
jgi:hypothetical protein